MLTTKTKVMKYTDYLKTNHWKELRLRKLRRKGGSKRRCAICANEKNLDVHHLNYRNLFDVKDSDLRILCRDCHYFAHDLEGKGLLKYKNDNQHHRFQLLKNAVKRYKGLTHNLFYDHTDPNQLKLFELNS